MENIEIHIVGGPGSGKTHLANKISNMFSIPIFELDKVFWNCEVNNYNTKNPDHVREKLFECILLNNKWIIEGVYYRWCEKSFADSDLIIILNTNIIIRQWRITLRFIKRKLGIIKSKHENMSDFIELFKWNSKYDSDNMVRIKEYLIKYKSKILETSSFNEIAKYIQIKYANESRAGEQV